MAIHTPEFAPAICQKRSPCTLCGHRYTEAVTRDTCRWPARGAYCCAVYEACKQKHMPGSLSYAMSSNNWQETSLRTIDQVFQHGTSVFPYVCIKLGDSILPRQHLLVNTHLLPYLQVAANLENIHQGTVASTAAPVQIVWQCCLTNTVLSCFLSRTVCSSAIDVISTEVFVLDDLEQLFAVTQLRVRTTRVVTLKHCETDHASAVLAAC